MANTGKYKAFISYSHVDRKQAELLFNRLESYRIPNHLRQKLELNTGRLGTFFRDRDELRAGGNLSHQISEALIESEYLIVVCSPDAAQSRWVNKEISEFKKIHGEERILAVIIRGEPNARPEKESHECFPEALRFQLNSDGAISASSAEPLAADFRKGMDGTRLGFLKLVAALADIDLARLQDRDQQRRQRRVTAITLISFIGMIVMSGLTLFALDARNAADRSRAEAEGLIEFMLVPLREGLESVGRLDILRDVAARALTYYEDKQPSRMDADSLGRRARVMHNIGEIKHKLGDTETSQAHFDQAYDITEKLYLSDPKNTQWIFDHAQSSYWLGFIPYNIGNYKTAEKYFLQYASLANQLVEIDRNNSLWNREVAYAQTNLAVLYRRIGAAPDDTLNRFIKAAEIFEQFWQTNKSDNTAIIDLGDAYGWVSRNYSDKRDFANSLLWREKQFGFYTDRTSTGPKNWRLIRERAGAGYAIAEIYKNQRHYEAALEFLLEKKHITDSLIIHDNENTDWIIFTSAYYILIAECYLHLNQTISFNEKILYARTLLSESNIPSDNQQRIFFENKILTLSQNEKKGK